MALAGVKEKAEYISAVPAGIDQKESFKNKAYQELKNAGVDDLEQKCCIEFGLLGGTKDHRGVLLKVMGEDKLAFRLDLQKKKVHQVVYKCPQCTFEADNLKAFREHLENDHKQLGFTQNCCGINFDSLIGFRHHVLDQHGENVVSGVSLAFQKIGNDSHPYDEFMKMNEDKLTFYPDNRKIVSFKEIIDAALLIIDNFGSYFLFFWNCQDFAAWFLTFSGIPLTGIAPTGMDTFTGSGFSQGSVRDLKGWLFYKDLNQNEKASVKKYLPAVPIVCEQCPKYLPPMSIGDLQIHEFAHSNVQN